jgi:hypothetical protein
MLQAYESGVSGVCWLIVRNGNMLGKKWSEEALISIFPSEELSRLRDLLAIHCGQQTTLPLHLRSYTAHELPLGSDKQASTIAIDLCPVRKPIFHDPPVRFGDVFGTTESPQQAESSLHGLNCFRSGAV